MLDFTTKEIERSLEELNKKVNEEMAITSDYVAVRIGRMIDKMKGHDEDTKKIYKYHSLVSVYANCARELLLVCNDKEKFKGCCYLAARAGEICYTLYDKGYRDVGNMRSLLMSLKDRSNAWHYVQFAILCNSRELAIRIASEDTLLGSVLMQDYEKAKRYLPEKFQDIRKWSWEEQILWTIVYQEEKKMNQLFEKDIRELRRQTKIAGATYFSSFILACIKLAKEREMKYTLNVKEVPWHLLDDDPVKEDEWQLPEDSSLEELLSS